MSDPSPSLPRDEAQVFQSLPAVLAALAVSAHADGRQRFEAVLAGTPLDATVAAQRVADERLPSLTPSRPPAARLWQLSAVRSAVSSVLGPTPDRVAAVALAAGLLQINDWLDESHQASQSIEGAGPTRSGDYWHAIMHRREPDYGNAKYWFRQVGRHPVSAALIPSAMHAFGESAPTGSDLWLPRLVSGGRWEPTAFVDLCETVASDQSSPLGLAARRMQWAEMLLLLEHCRREASST